jgi:Squalene-hopene cyclase C-terminal domain
VIRRLSHALPVLLALAAFGGAASRGDERQQSVPSGTPPAPAKIQRTVDRALSFLVKDAARWRSERGCATCHHGAMTVWALGEARLRGYSVNAETLADEVKWTKDLFVGQFSKPRDSRWGYNFVSLPGMYLATMSDTLPVLSRNEVQRMAVHLERHQEADGVWQMPPPNANTSPPTFESPETLALWGLLAWEPSMLPDSAAATNRAARARAANWLAHAKPTETTQSLALRLRLAVHDAESPSQLALRVDHLLKRQHADGGWSQLQELPSDAYATGQVLWALNFASIPSDHAAVARAVSFLVAQQQDNGAWPMSPRTHPDAHITRPRNLVPITYFGTAWATLGLVRFVPPLRDEATMQQLAFQSLKGLSGSYTVDEKSPGKPVTSIRVRYELDDEQLASLARLLPAFPALQSLELKSPHLTDATTEHLARLSQLRNLTLEDAAITDGGLAHLKNLTSLEQLNVKGTKVTAAGIADLCRVRPKLKVQH